MLLKSVEILKRDLKEERERKSALELVESDLLHKLETQEREIGDLKTALSDWD